ncbi:20933_t:CDS:2 [Gigaspora margarita]|uniref:20933_t:CDS:1 n=1 Tax=Gigaspora margarita TaxID=4874 RepID=A0ABN7UQL1_GIGMA|nr:20933_t:CDS:2 [Gigaspora margarita]
MGIYLKQNVHQELIHKISVEINEINKLFCKFIAFVKVNFFKKISQSTIQIGAQSQNNNGQLQRRQNIVGLQNVSGQLQRLQNTEDFIDTQQHTDLVNGTYPLTEIRDIENQTQQSAQFSAMLFSGFLFHKHSHALFFSKFAL